MNPLLLIKSRKPSVLIQMVMDKFFNSRMSKFQSLEHFFKGKIGVEIGGPSLFFMNKGYMPLYSLAEGIDGCNFSSHTTWEGDIKEGKTYSYAPQKFGHQYICDGVDVPIIPKNKYDFVLSCNNLEHIANPLKAVENWVKLLKSEGVIVLVLPRKESNFDNKRSIISFQHLLDDYNNNIDEHDLTHLNEILEMHDLKYDPLAGNFEDFRQRSMDNFNNRCLHHHVYDLDLLKKICTHFGLTTLVKASRTADHIIVAKK